MGTIGSTVECEITKQFGSHYICMLLQHSLVQLRILKIHTLIPKMLLFFAVKRLIYHSCSGAALKNVVKNTSSGLQWRTYGIQNVN